MAPLKATKMAVDFLPAPFGDTIVDVLAEVYRLGQEVGEPHTTYSVLGRLEDIFYELERMESAGGLDNQTVEMYTTTLDAYCRNMAAFRDMNAIDRLIRHRKFKKAIASIHKEIDNLVGVLQLSDARFMVDWLPQYEKDMRAQQETLALKAEEIQSERGPDTKHDALILLKATVNQRDETTEALTDASHRCAKLTDDAGPLFRVVLSRLRAVHEQLKTVKANDTPYTDSATAAFDAKLKAFLKELESYTTASFENGNYTYKKLFADHVIEHKKVIAALSTIYGDHTGNNSARDGLDIVFTRLENDATTNWDAAFEDEQAKWINRLTARVHDDSMITPYKEDALLALETVTRLYDAKQGRDAAEWQNNELARTLWDKLQALNDSAEMPEWFVPRSAIKLGKWIRSGSFGDVYYGTRLGLGTPVVIKRLIKQDGRRLDEQARAKFIDEAKHWYGLQDRHILRMYGACHLAVPPFFVCEEAQAGDLRRVLAWDKSKMWRLLRDSARGIGYLHSRNIVHGDLKLDNIIVGDDGSARVADFGLSRKKDPSRLNHFTLNNSIFGAGALQWRAPEALNYKAQIPSDVYSFAICIIEAVSGELPYANLTIESEVIAKIRATELPERPEHMPDTIWELIQRMTVLNPSERATITEAIDALKDQADIEINDEVERQGPDTQNHERLLPLIAVGLADGNTNSASTAMTSVPTTSTPSNGGYGSTTGQAPPMPHGSPPIQPPLPPGFASVVMTTSTTNAPRGVWTSPLRQGSPIAVTASLLVSKAVVPTQAALAAVPSFKYYYDRPTDLPRETDRTRMAMFARTINQMKVVDKAILCPSPVGHDTACPLSHSYLEVMRYNPLFKRLVCRQPTHYWSNRVEEKEDCVCIHVDTGLKWEWLDESRGKRSYCSRGDKCTNTKCIKSHSFEELCWYNPAFKVKKCAIRAHDHIARSRGTIAPPLECNYYHIEVGRNADKRQLMVEDDHVGKNVPMLFIERTHKPLADALEALRYARAPNL